MINGLPVAVVDFIGRPAFRQTGSQTQLISREVHAQQRFDEQPIHPASRTRIPSPAATACVRRDRIDVRRDDVRLNFVGGDLFGSPTVMDGIEQREEFPRTVVFAHEGKGHGGPNRGVSVLAAILAHTRNVTLDVTGIERRFVERRIEQLDHSGIAADQARACYLHCCLLPVSNKAMTNTTLRERFRIAEQNYSIASRIIADTLEAELIKQEAPTNKSKKMARY